MTKCKPHIFVLTLAGAEDRRGPLVKQLDDQRLSYELFFGIDGRSGLPAEYENLIDRQSAQENLGRPMSDPEFACAPSHNKIYHKIIEREISCAIILENDITISDQLVPFFYNPHLDVLCLAYNAEKGFAISQNLMITSGTQTMSCYILKASAIAELLDCIRFSVENLSLVAQGLIMRLIRFGSNCSGKCFLPWRKIILPGNGRLFQTSNKVTKIMAYNLAL